MRLCVFEDSSALQLEPLSLTRPVFALWSGACTLLERTRRALPTGEVGALVRPALVDFCRRRYPDLAVNDPAFMQARDLVLVNARWLPPSHFSVDTAHAHVGLVGKQIAYVMLPSGTGGDLTTESIDGWLEQAAKTLPSMPAGGGIADYLWDLVDANPELLGSDLEWFARLPGKRTSAQNAAILGPPHHIIVDESAVLEPQVVIDTRPGPVLIDRGAVVQAFSHIEGPCYIGPETWIAGAKVRGGTFGPMCRLGGEIEASIVQGYSNKYHDGFLGHSYIGEWVNLAAGTQTSDLRNDYGKVKVAVAGHRIATGKTKVGSFIGDHSKTGLGAFLNTGSAIGVFCNLLPSGSLLPSVVPSFCQVSDDQVSERWDMRSLFTTAAIVMRRRGQEWSETHRDFFYGLYDQTAEERRRVQRESELRRIRRSG